MKYDLAERTSNFSKAVLRFSKTVPLNAITAPILNQLIRASTSIGANYMEANNASSRNDFRNKIFICKKEAQETKYWLDIIATYSDNAEIVKLLKEIDELIRIFQKISSSLKNEQSSH